MMAKVLVRPMILAHFPPFPSFSKKAVSRNICVWPHVVCKLANSRLDLDYIPVLLTLPIFFCHLFFGKGRGYWVSYPWLRSSGRLHDFTLPSRHLFLLLIWKAMVTVDLCWWWPGAGNHFHGPHIPCCCDNCARSPPQCSLLLVSSCLHHYSWASSHSIHSCGAWALKLLVLWRNPGTFQDLWANMWVKHL